MYKVASKNRQHALRVAAPLPTGGFIGAEADPYAALPSPASMPLSDAVSENGRLQLELVRKEAELAAAKATGDDRAIRLIGQVLQTIVQRKALVKSRMKDLRNQVHGEALGLAIRELVPEQAAAIFSRANEIAKEVQAS